MFLVPVLLAVPIQRVFSPVVIQIGQILPTLRAKKEKVSLQLLLVRTETERRLPTVAEVQIQEILVLVVVEMVVLGEEVEMNGMEAVH
jgi:hypothetical protein